MGHDVKDAAFEVFKNKTAAQAAFEHELESIFRTKIPEHFWVWIDNHYYLAAEVSNTSGMRWTSRGYQKTACFVMADLDTPELNIIKGTQLGISHLAVAFAIYEVVERARTTGNYLPIDRNAMSFSNMLDYAIKNIDVAAQALKVEVGKKDRENTNFKKGFDKGSIYSLAANSPSNYDLLSFSSVVQDELSRMPLRVSNSKDEEGDSPYDAVKSRMDAAEYVKHITLSSPEEVETCAIHKVHSESEIKVEQHIPCPCCGHFQPLSFNGTDGNGGMKWHRQVKGDGSRDNVATSKTAYFECRACSEPFQYKDMFKLDDQYGELRNEEVRLSVPDRCWYYIDKNEPNDPSLIDEYYRKHGNVRAKPYSVGLRIPSTFSRTKSWADGVKQWLDAVDKEREGDNSKMKTFVKKYLAMAYTKSKDNAALDHTVLQIRAVNYIDRFEEEQTTGLPNEIQAVFGWWDLQQDWIQGGYIGYGYGGESWWLRNLIRLGDPATSNVLDHIDKWQDHKFVRRDGTVLRSLLTGIDSGDRPNLAYDKSIQLGRRRVIPTKGASTYGHPYMNFPDAPKQNCKHTFMTTIGTIAVKDLLYGRILRVHESGPGYVHFPKHEEEFNENFFKGIASEEKIFKGGHLTYEKTYARNEPLDIAVGCDVMKQIAELPRYGLRFSQNVGTSQQLETPKQEVAKTSRHTARAWRKRSG